MDDRLPTGLWVMAHVRAADVQGVPMVVARKGDPGRGTVLLKINRRNGLFDILVQTRRDEELVWSRPLGPDPMDEAAADTYIARQVKYDPDLWVVEVEDRQGRPWFEGRVV